MRCAAQGIAVAAVGLAALVGLPPASAEPAAQFEVLCTPTDPGLAELSGLAVADGLIYAIGDSGSDDMVAEMDTQCAVRQWLPVPIDPRDVEDLAVGPDGRLWLADLGDNNRQRESVALIGMGRDGGASGVLHRLTYPDGPHDGEALLLGPDGVPVIVTKVVRGEAGVYVPADGATMGSLAEPGPSPLVQVGTVQFAKTTTAGGPIPGVKLTSITGGAVSADGDVVALRTYTDVYLYRVSGGDIAGALAGQPTRVPLPGQPQGEAIAFTADGDLLAGSEAAAGGLPPLLGLRGAVGLAGESAAAAATAPSSSAASASAPSISASAASTPAAAAPSSAPPSDGAAGGTSGAVWGFGVAAAVVVAAGLAVGALGISRRRR